ncbi:hypothetical protein [Gemmatimonas sp. UBA7669]|uniref:hypothetical protein n=1 Tax=Gemmatimonas sp. UBA7669 TaxID=1946568 RepID=UPI0025C61572|nr:hypothetical protein [Gemmatimonas sp. UBA7669]
MKTITIRRQAPLLLTTSVPALLAGLFSGCGLFTGPKERVAQVDSIAVAAVPTPSGSAKLTFFGVVGFNLCAELVRVERRVSGDTLTWRFIARNEGSNCLQAVATLRHEDSVPNLPARTVVIRAERSNGEPLLRTLQLPLAAPTQR